MASCTNDLGAVWADVGIGVVVCDVSDQLFCSTILKCVFNGTHGNELLEIECPVRSMVHNILVHPMHHYDLLLEQYDDTIKPIVKHLSRLSLPVVLY